jgi:uroporphyrinogen III methyltransferase/synthase
MELPTIEIQPPSDFTALDRAIAKLASYDWIIFTSANGVKFFQERLPGGVENVRANICAIGPATRKAVEMLGLIVHLMPKEYVAESLVDAFSAEDLNGKRILLPRAAVARDVVPEQLRRLGARVDVVEAYRTAVPANAAARAREIFSAARKPDWITFTSSSTVKNFFAAGGAGALEGVRVASIGPVTSKTVRSLGMTVTAEASVYTTDGLIEAILSATG